MIKLTPRLQAVCDMVPEGAKVADIGADHGYVSIYLIESGRASSAIAMDVNKGPIERANANIEAAGLKDVIKTRLSDGADELESGEADTLLIAGMGARLMCDILSRALSDKVIKTLVLSPHSEVFLIREFLRMAGFTITDEDMVIDEGKYYPVILAVSDGEKADMVDITLEDEFGPVLLKKRPDAFESFLLKEKTKTEEIIKKVTSEEKRDELKGYLELVTKAVNYK